MLAPALAAAAQAFPGAPGYWRSLDPGAAALLVEFGADRPAGLDDAEARAAGLVGGANLLHPVEFTRDEDRIELYWRIRGGLLGIVGQQRPAGTALIIEDVCSPPDRVAEGAHDLQELLSRHSFLPNAAGHAAYGNLHFSDAAIRPLGKLAETITATTLAMSRIVAGYIDQTSEEMVAAYTQARENWLRNLSAVRAARIRDLLSGERIDVSAAEATPATGSARPCCSHPPPAITAMPGPAAA